MAGGQSWAAPHTPPPFVPPPPGLQVGAARVVGSGAYAIQEKTKKGHTTHLTYTLELPHDPGVAQAEFELAKEGEFVLTIKARRGHAARHHSSCPPPPHTHTPHALPAQNPERAKGTRGAAPAPDPGLHTKADYPVEQKKEFANYAWIPCHDPRLLDFAHAEFLLVAVSDEGKHIERHAAEGDEEALIDALRREIQVSFVTVSVRERVDCRPPHHTPHPLRTLAGSSPAPGGQDGHRHRASRDWGDGVTCGVCVWACVCAA